MIREKDKCRSKYKKNHNPRDLLEFELLRERVDRKVKTDYRRYLALIEDRITGNPNLLWSFIKDSKNLKSQYPSTMYLNNVTANNNVAMCNLFADHFSSSFLPPASFIFNNQTVPLPFGLNTLSEIHLSSKSVFEKLKSLKPSRSSGTDGIPPFFLKFCARGLATPLTFIFNKSLQTSTFPAYWKKAFVVPIYKKGDNTLINNYRPISLLSSLSKVFESLICPFLSWHIKEMLSPQQHGFVARKSTTTNLMTYVNEVATSIDSGLQTDAVYTDFSSAFDRVDHSILLEKLEHRFGITGNLLLWLRSYLSNRSQVVVKDGHFSKTYFTTSGVPQGSHLGPMLFILFIDDIVQQVKYSKCLLYADDLKLYRTIRSPEDSNLLQADLSSIEDWCALNNMTLNAGKCYHIKFTKKHNPHNSMYTLDGIKLAEVNKIRDLGVVLDSKLNFISHIDHISQCSNKMLGFIKRVSKSFKKTKTLKTLYCALVRSRLEYCCQVWNPCYQVHIDRLEKIQRSFTRFLTYKAKCNEDPNISQHADYATRLEHFKLNSLQKRRSLLDMTFLHKLINGAVSEPFLLSELNFNIPKLNCRSGRIDRDTFRKRQHRSNVGKFSALNRIQSSFNYIQSSSSVDIFSGSTLYFKRQMLQSYLSNTL